ncbi:class I SAM-dependent methyltransferase [Roseovarius sp. B08]|uniref:class I SAM-dependent methyltransferase n=1 Tax=Roseovarius sp. B08 TaxID=3449223 RepID=UPI003EDBE4E3
MAFANEERKRISEIAKDSWYEKPTALATIRYSFDIFRRFMKDDDKILEMGPAEGTMTKQLIEAGCDIECLEGSPEFAEILRSKFPDLKVHVALFEDWECEPTYDVILLGHVLEHVDNPPAILSRAKNWLRPGGQIVCSVPNCRSLHRQAAVIMGLMETEQDMSEKDVHHGHRRVYSPETLRADFTKAGMTVDFFGGYWMKPISDGQIEEQWTPEMLEAFMKLGERYPDIAAELVIVASDK